MEHFTHCEEVNTIFTIKETFMVFQVKINKYTGNIFTETSQDKN